MLGGCAQNNKQINNLTMQYSEQTADSLFSQLKKYDYEPNYEINIDTKNSYDVLVNDLLMSCDYGRIIQERSFFINWGILKSGKQRLQVKLYPKYSNGKQLETLTNNDFLKLTVSSFTWRKDGYGTENEDTVLTYQLPRLDANNRPIDYSKQKELVINLEFDAKVPYELKGWTDGIVFNKKDSTILKQKLASIYQEQINDFKNKRFDLINAQSVIHDFEIGQSVYDTKESLLKSLKEYDELKDKDLNFLPLEKYDIFFYGDGRVITLRRINNEYKGCSPFIRLYTDDNGAERVQTNDLYFYQPKGSDKLVLIR